MSKIFGVQDEDFVSTRVKMFESSQTIKCYGMCSKRIPFSFLPESTTLKNQIFRNIPNYSKNIRKFLKNKIFEKIGFLKNFHSAGK